jgi:tRNA (guanine-N7-)-methyltransferase
MGKPSSKGGRPYLSLAPFLHWPALDRPLKWGEIFGRPGPVYLEIGFGLGDFIVAQAKAHPERDFVGVELQWSPVRRALRKAALARLQNVRILLADIHLAMDRLFGERSFQEAYALFPCPWPKERHSRYRLFSNGFLRRLNTRMVDGGAVLVVTDHEPFLEWMISEIPGTGFHCERSIVPPFCNTKYELKWRARGQTSFFSLRLTKRAHLDLSTGEENPMRIHTLNRFDPLTFRPRNARGEIVVEFKEWLYDGKIEKGMTRVIVVEDPLVQDFWIEIARYGEGWRIRPARGCAVIPTIGAQRALDLVREQCTGPADSGAGPSSA